MLFGEAGYLSVASRFVFCSTLFIYAAHRIVGLQKVASFQDRGRFKVIAKYRTHIRVYALAGALGAAWYFWQLERCQPVAAASLPE